MIGHRPLGVGVVGLGVGADHARAWARDDRCELRWLYDLDGERADRLAAEIGRGKRAHALETVLDDPDVDVVSIASYDDAHFAQVSAALEAGKHVFAEKPLCRSRAELTGIHEAWRAAGDRHLATNFVLRAAPLYRWLREAITSGELGHIYAFDGDYLYGRLQKITDGWRGRIEKYSVMQGGGVHVVDLMIWLTGQTPALVTATGNRICTASTAFRYEDYVAATYRFPSGLVGRITANFGCVHRHQHVVRVFGTRATFIHDDQGARLHPTRDPDSRPRCIALAGRPALKGALIPPFVDAVLAGGDAALTRHDFQVTAACLAADDALASGRTAQVLVP